MTPTQSQLWQFLGLAQWQCVHPERLPYAPVPLIPCADILLVFGESTELPEVFVKDILAALSLSAKQVSTVSQAHWLAAGKPSATLLLGINVTDDLQPFHWHSSHWPLSSEQKRSLWSCLWHCYLEH